MSKKFFVATPPKRKSFPDKKTAFRVLSKGMFYEFCLPLFPLRISFTPLRYFCLTSFFGVGSFNVKADKY